MIKARCSHCLRSVNVRQLEPWEFVQECSCGGGHLTSVETVVLCARCIRDFEENGAAPPEEAARLEKVIDAARQAEARN